MRSLQFSVRTRLAMLFGAVFLLAGASLLLINYVLVNQVLPSAIGFVASFNSPTNDPATLPMPPGNVARAPDPSALVNSISDYRASTLRTLLLASGVALIIAGAIAALLGWLVAGRALRPLHTITATARRLGAESLDRRINLVGPVDELKELADTFDGMLDRLASAFDSQRRFVASASHELRTPLAVQRTLVEVAMADPTASPEMLRLGQHLLHTNERSERLIEGLLMLARSDQGLVSRTPVRLDEVVDTVLLGCAAMATDRGVTITSELGPRTVVGDRILLERLVANLVHNAVNYNVPGGCVLVGVGDDPALVVRNSGAAVPADEVTGLFEPFRRLNRTHNADRPGAGLGLSIVASVARAHGGTVHAEPNLDGGLRVALYLPAVRGTMIRSLRDRVPTPPSAVVETLVV